MLCEAPFMKHLCKALLLSSVAKHPLDRRFAKYLETTGSLYRGFEKPFLFRNFAKCSKTTEKPSQRLCKSLSVVKVFITTHMFRSFAQLITNILAEIICYVQNCTDFQLHVIRKSSYCILIFMNQVFSDLAL